MSKEEKVFPGVDFKQLLENMIPEQRDGIYHVEANNLSNAEYAAHTLQKRGVPMSQIVFYWLTTRGRREMPAETFYAGCREMPRVEAVEPRLPPVTCYYGCYNPENPEESKMEMGFMRRFVPEPIKPIETIGSIKKE